MPYDMFSFIGAGISMIFVSCITLLNTIFSGRQRSLCLAIHGTSVPLAGIVYPYLLDSLVSTYGLSGTFLILGGLFCNTFVFSLFIWLYRGELTPKKEDAPDERKPIYSDSKTHQKLFITKGLQFLKDLISKRYICLVVASGLALSTLNGYLDFVFDIAAWKEYDESQANIFFVIFNVFGCVFSILPGLMKLILDIDTYFYPFLFAVLVFSGSLMMYFSKTYAVYAVGTACVGAGPAIVTCAFIICGQVLRLEQIAVAAGILDTIIGLMSASTGPLFGAIRDNSGSYSLVFAIISAAQAIAAVLFIADIILRKLNGMPSLSDFPQH